MSLKHLFLVSILALGLAGPAQAQVQIPDNLPESCLTMALSMINIAQDRDETGATPEEQAKYYLNFLHGAGVEKLSPFHKRVLVQIKEIGKLSPLTPKTLQPLVDKEMGVCKLVNGDYDKLKGI